MTGRTSASGTSHDLLRPYANTQELSSSEIPGFWCLSTIPVITNDQTGATGATGASEALESASPHMTIDNAKDFGKPSSPSVKNLCQCIKCSSVGNASYSLHLATKFGKRLVDENFTSLARWELPCRFPRCGQFHITTTFFDLDGVLGIWGRERILKHERDHFHQDNKYKCAEHNCRAATTKFSDLRRHHATTHCKNRTLHPCPVIGCKHSGENGWVRKDKLKSHFKNVHQKDFPGCPAKATGTSVSTSQTHGSSAGDPQQGYSGGA